MTTATAAKAKKGKAGKAAAVEATWVDIPKGTLETAIDTISIDLSDIAIKNKNDRNRDAKFEESIRDLAMGIRQVGLLQPITVRKAKKPSDVEYILVAGERRYRAAQLLGWQGIPAVVLNDNVDELDARAAENLQREDLDEDVKAFTVGAMLDREVRVLLDEQGVKDLADLDAPAIDSVNVAATKRVAERMGWPVPRVRDYAFTAELPEEVLSLARQGRLPMGHLRVLAQVPDPKRAVQLAENYAAGENPALEPVKSLDDLKTMVSRETCRLAGVPWDLTVAFAGAPACVKCPHNSANRTGLFDGADLRPGFTSQFDASRGPLTDKAIEVGLCSKLSCYRAKATATKSAWRGAGDRIAAKVAAAKPAERPKLLPQLVKEAAAKCAFVPLTTFGKLAKERIEQKLEAGTPAKKAKDSADRKKNDETNEQRWKAEGKLRDAERAISVVIEEKVVASLREEEPWRQLLMFAVMNLSVGRTCFDYGRAKPAEVAKFKALVQVVLDGGKAEATDAVAAAMGKHDGFDFDLGNLKDQMVLVDIFGLKDIPPAPKLADFLPKPKAEEKKPAADKKAKAKPAKKGKAKKAAKRSTGMPGIHEDDCVNDGVASDGGAGSEEA